MEQPLEAKLQMQLNSHRQAFAEATAGHDPAASLLARKQIALTAMALAGLHGRELTDFLPELLPPDSHEVTLAQRGRARLLAQLVFAAASPYSGDEQGLIEAVADGEVVILDQPLRRR